MYRLDMSPYIEQINRVQDYIESNIDQNITVIELSRIANFSEYHFQRIFSLVTGESLFGFVKRIRLEKAAYMLLANRDRPVTDIALSVGFANQSSFAKAFKLKYGISSSSYRKEYNLHNEIEEQGYHISDGDIIMEPLKIDIRYEKPIDVIYTRYTGPYKGDGHLFSSLFYRLYTWADARDIITKESRWFVIYHDSGHETIDDQLRLSVCMSVHRNVAVGGDIGIMTIDEGRYGVGSFMVNTQEYSRAWNYMYLKWLPSTDYRLDDRFTLEHYPPIQDGDDKRLVEIYIPIK